MNNFNGLDPVELMVDALLDPERAGEMFAEALVITSIIVWYRKPENRKFMERFAKMYPLFDIKPPIIKDLVGDKNLISKWICIMTSVEDAREEKMEILVNKMAMYN